MRRLQVHLRRINPLITKWEAWVYAHFLPLSLVASGLIWLRYNERVRNGWS